MKRFHIHLSVQDLPKSIGFYSALFGAPPTVQKSDYAKWMLDDPCVNFAISKRGAAPGLNHLGLQVDSNDELLALRQQLSMANIDAIEQRDTACCYARSDKHWTEDPQGIAWETFHTLDSVPVFNIETTDHQQGNTCCAPFPELAKTRASGCC